MVMSSIFPVKFLLSLNYLRAVLAVSFSSSCNITACWLNSASPLAMQVSIGTIIMMLAAALIIRLYTIFASQWFTKE